MQLAVGNGVSSNQLPLLGESPGEKLGKSTVSHGHAGHGKDIQYTSMSPFLAPVPEQAGRGKT